MGLKQIATAPTYVAPAATVTEEEKRRSEQAAAVAEQKRRDAEEQRIEQALATAKKGPCTLQLSIKVCANVRVCEYANVRGPLRAAAV